MLRHEWQPKHRKLRYQYPAVCLCPDDHDADCELLRPIDVQHIGGSWGVAAVCIWFIGMLVAFAWCS
jgi:hypothetical protein